MTAHQLYAGHGFTYLTDVDESDPEHPHVTGIAAGCQCGWNSDIIHPYLDASGEAADQAEIDAEKQWETEHIADLADTAVPYALADQIRSVGRQLDALIEADKPMAALAAIRLSGGYFARQARDAALRASFLDNSWAEIGEALGISKQAAWERYGKARREPATSS
ncbi:hypothetical protein [Kitasatospora purpeofusca]|uniref:hypothetical protein n=1 Tax=Kitasatospora purpeofusca TaxID=67352 RepID=UPI0036D2E7A1